MSNKESGAHFAKPDSEKTKSSSPQESDNEQVDLTAKIPTTDEQPTVEPFVTLHSNETSLEAATSRSHRGSLARIALLSIVVLFVVVYLGGVWTARHYFLPNTTLNGEEVSLQNASQVAANHTKATEGYKIDITGDGFELSMNETDIKLCSDGEAYVKEALDQINAWAWPLELTSKHDLKSSESVTFDHEAANDIMKKALDEFNQNATQPTDASLSYDQGTHTFSIAPEQVGTALDSEKVLQATDQALVNLDRQLVLTEDDLAQPKLKSDDAQLTKAAEEANKKLSAVQKLKVGDKDVVEVNADYIGKWITVNENYEVTVNTDAIVEWARGDLSDQFDTVGASRSYTRPDGKQASVKGGSYGWTIDGAALGQQISDHIKNGETATIDIPMQQTADNWNPGGQDWGPRYIDIDISEQHVRLYDASSNLIWESDCVTGNPNQGHDTPEGVYQINNNKESGDVELEGPIDDKTGEPEYISHVTYWMPFVWNAVALHDASWRYSFGGDIYKNDGSHGCVNLPSEKAAELYDLCQVDDVVVVHY